jgi:hypothetical protein
MGVWEQIDYLSGQSLKTLERHKPFEVTEVTPEDIQIFVYSNLKKRRIKRLEIEGAWEELREEGLISSSDIRQRHSKNNSTYVAAILASLPGVTHQIKPIRLSVSVE